VVDGPNISVPGDSLGDHGISCGPVTSRRREKKAYESHACTCADGAGSSRINSWAGGFEVGWQNQGTTPPLYGSEKVARSLEQELAPTNYGKRLGEGCLNKRMGCYRLVNVWCLAFGVVRRAAVRSTQASYQNPGSRSSRWIGAPLQPKTRAWRECEPGKRPRQRPLSSTESMEMDSRWATHKIRRG
jgi:hypothetical protein